MNKKSKYLFLAKTLNPFVLILYGVFCFYLYSLGQYGGVRRKVPIITGLGILLLLWLLLCFYKERKKRKKIEEDQGQLEITRKIVSKPRQIIFSKSWFFIACILILAITFITSIKIYQSAIPYNGKLSWFIRDLKNKQQVSFVHNNIYDNDIQGIFDDIESKIKLPEDLYLSTNFNLKFKKDGIITSFDTYVYGKDKKGQTESFLISYDQTRSEKINVYLKGVVKDDFSEEKKLQPLIKTLQLVSIEDTVLPWNEEQYGVLYAGVRNWGYHTEGIFYVEEDGNISKEENVIGQIRGYTVSVYVPGKEELYIPARFIYKDKDYVLEGSTENKEQDKEWKVGYTYNDGEETFFINKKLGYQLSVVDAALGSRFYALLQTKDGGKNWETMNEDPFLNQTGVSSGIVFINESLGFIALSHNGGSQAELYRTTDGGLSYEEISLPTMEVSLGEDQVQEPFDFPGMPYEENGEVLLLVGQGQDGDYKGGIKALYHSEDNGKTWIYVKEQYLDNK